MTTEQLDQADLRPDMPFINQAVELSKQFVQHYYQLDSAWCYEHCSPDLVFIGNARDLFGVSRDEFVRKMATLVGKARLGIIGDVESLVMPSSNGDIAIVLLRYFIATSPTSADLAVARRRTSLFWVPSERGPLLAHFHASTPSNNIVDTAAEPVGKLQQESHRYSQAIRDQLTHRLGTPVRDVEGSVSYLLPPEVRYVEASRQRCIIHCLERDVVVRSGFGDLVRTFDDVLVTVHRSFAVNPLHVREIRMDSVVLTDNTVIPIPRKRARCVRTNLRHAIDGRQGTESPRASLMSS